MLKFENHCSLPATLSSLPWNVISFHQFHLYSYLLSQLRQPIKYLCYLLTSAKILALSQIIGILKARILTHEWEILPGPCFRDSPFYLWSRNVKPLFMSVASFPALNKACTFLKFQAPLKSSSLAWHFPTVPEVMAEPQVVVAQVSWVQWVCLQDKPTYHLSDKIRFFYMIATVN